MLWNPLRKVGGVGKSMSRPFPIEHTLLLVSRRPNGGYPCQYLLSKETNEEHIEELRTTTQYTAAEGGGRTEDGGRRRSASNWTGN